MTGRGPADLVTGGKVIVFWIEMDDLEFHGMRREQD